MSATAMSSDGLINAANNDKSDYDSIVHHVKMLRSTLDRVAEKLAKANAAWHDDPAADDHAAHHAPAIEQYPRDVRDEAIRELVRYYLSELTIAE